MPKKTTTNSYVTKQELELVLKPYATKKDLALALEPYATKQDLLDMKNEILTEVRAMFDEFTKVMMDNFALIYKDLHDTKLTQSEHTRQIDQHIIDIEDLQQDVGLLQTLNTI